MREGYPPHPAVLTWWQTRQTGWYRFLTVPLASVTSHHTCLCRNHSGGERVSVPLLLSITLLFFFSSSQNTLNLKMWVLLSGSLKSVFFAWGEGKSIFSIAYFSFHSRLIFRAWSDGLTLQGERFPGSAGQVSLVQCRRNCSKQFEGASLIAQSSLYISWGPTLPLRLMRFSSNYTHSAASSRRTLLEPVCVTW